MIWDCFTFFNELALLELRLRTLDSVVDRFVLVESPVTHQGGEKSLYYADHREWFAPWKDRIVHVVCDSPACTPWGRENWQREQIELGLVDADPDDIVIISDADEIPDPRDLPGIRPPCRLSGSLCYYWLNCMAIGHWWDRPVVVRRGVMQSPNICRVDRNVAPRAGGRAWHFSYLGGPERIAEKLLSFAHAEYSTPNWTDTARIQRAMDARIDLFDRGGTFAVVPVDESFPEPLQKEPERWKEYLCDLL